MIVPLAIVVGLAAAVLLLTAGYLFGVRRGAEARVALNHQHRTHALELAQLRVELSQSGGDRDEKLKETLQQILAPLVERDQISLGLSKVTIDEGHHGDLAKLLDQIADKGNFSAVLLSDDDGWPMAASSNARDVDKLSATSSLLQVMADRMVRGDEPVPLSLMVYDADNVVTLCRLFRVADRRFALTAVAPGAQLTPVALDPALVKVSAVLASREG
ncbi:MAG: hypothetical protein WBP72_13510 [Rhodocyclaceae bacterium]